MRRCRTPSASTVTRAPVASVVTSVLSSSMPSRTMAPALALTTKLAMVAQRAKRKTARSARRPMVLLGERRFPDVARGGVEAALVHELQEVRDVFKRR